MPSFYETTKVSAEKDIASVLVDLEHKRFELELERPLEPLKIEEVGYRCIECKRIKPKDQFKKLFVREEGICKLCWDSEVEENVKEYLNKKEK